MNKPKVVRVEIDSTKFWKIGNPVLINVSVFKTLRDAGIPVDGAIELRGVLHGRLAMWRECREAGEMLIYEWQPGADSPKPAASPYTNDDEI